MSITELPDYQHLCTDLAQLPCDLNLSEFQGFVCGMLCINNNIDLTLAEVQMHMNDELDARPETRTLLQQFIRHTQQQLADVNISFKLLMPEEEQLLSVRAGALVDWTNGFLSGLGAGGLELSENEQSELSEIVTDLSTIAQIDDSSVSGNEVEEVAFTELEEYLRVAAITLYTNILLENKNVVRGETSHYLH